MNLVTLAVGVLCVIYGLVTLVLRASKPHLFRKLGPMRERFGQVGGTALHVVGYSLVPIGAGVFFILKGVRGESLF